MSNEHLIVPPRGVVFSSSSRDGDEVNLREMFDLLRAGRWTILKVAAIVFFLAYCLCVLSTPTFKSSGILQVDDISKTTAPAGSRKNILAILQGTPVQTAGEVQILKSRLVLDPVIAKMNLEVVSSPSHFPLFGSAIARRNSTDSTQPAGAWPGFGRWAWGGEQLSIASMDVPFDMLGSCLTLVAEGNTFKLTDFWGKELLRGRVGDEASSQDGRFHILVSSLRARPGTHFTVTKYSHDDTVQNLLNDLDVQELATSSGMIGVSFTSTSRQQAADFVNNLQATYLRQNIEKHSDTARNSKEFLEKQLPDLKEQMVSAQQQLADYERDHNAPNVSSETKILLQNTVTLQTKRLELQTELDKARQTFGPDNSKIKELTQAISSVAREQQQLSSRMQTLPTTGQDIQSLAREVKTYTQLYSAMNASIQSYEVAQAGTVGNVRVVDSASEPYRPVFPQIRLILILALPLGLFLGMLWVFAQRAMLRGLDNPNDLENTTGLPMHSMIPFSKQQQGLVRKARRSREGSRILAEIEPDDSAVETLRTLCASQAHNSIIMLCGPAPGVGKTFVTVNLGAVMAQSGRTTVLVDADLRRGNLHTYFGADAVPGITEFMSGGSTLETIVRHSDIQGLHYVTCGQKQPGSTEIVRHQRFADLMRILAANYECVLVTAPAVLAAPDAAILGRLANATLLVLRAAQHRPNEIQESFRRLSAAGVKVDGALLNRVGEQAGSYGYRGYGFARYKYG